MRNRFFIYPIKGQLLVYNLIKLLIMNALDGSKPKRFIKRTHDRNPTYHSFLVNDLLQYNPTNKKTQTKVKARSNSLLNINPESAMLHKEQNLYFDSLYMAENQFDKTRLRNPLNFMQKKPSPIIRNISSQLKYSQVSSSGHHKSSLGLNLDNLIKIDNLSWIKSKQTPNYNIINNLSFKDQMQ